MERTRTIESSVTIAAGFVLVLLSDGLAAEQPEVAVISTLFLLPLIIAGVNQRLYRSNFGLTVVYNFGLLVFNDLLMRTYLNLEEIEDRGLIALSFFVTLGVSLIPMLLHAWQTGRNRPQDSKFCTSCRCGLTLILGALTAFGYYAVFLA